MTTATATREKKIRPSRRTFGNWKELTYDGRLEYAGLTWYRVQGGFGGCDDREDWVADVPGQSMSVRRYKKDDGFGRSRDLTRDQAMDEEIRDHARWVLNDVEKATRELETQFEAQRRLRAAVEQIGGDE